MSTFDISTFDKDRLQSPATLNQCRALSFHFSTKKDGIDWQLQRRIQGCLYGLTKSKSKKLRFTFEKASNLFKVKKLPKVYQDEIAKYLIEKKLSK